MRVFRNIFDQHLRVDFHCRVICVKLTFASKIEAMYERSRDNVKVEPRSTSFLSHFKTLSIGLAQGRLCQGDQTHSWILDSTPLIPDSRYWVPVFVSGTWTLDFNCQWDSGFLKLCSEFQSPGFQISQAKFPRVRILKAKISQIPESRLPYKGQPKHRTHDRPLCSQSHYRLSVSCSGK